MNRNDDRSEKNGKEPFHMKSELCSTCASIVSYKFEGRLKKEIAEMNNLGVSSGNNFDANKSETSKNSNSSSSSSSLIFNNHSGTLLNKNDNMNKTMFSLTNSDPYELNSMNFGDELIYYPPFVSMYTIINFEERKNSGKSLLNRATNNNEIIEANIKSKESKIVFSIGNFKYVFLTDVGKLIKKLDGAKESLSDLKCCVGRSMDFEIKVLDVEINTQKCFVNERMVDPITITLITNVRPVINEKCILDIMTNGKINFTSMRIDSFDILVNNAILQRNKKSPNYQKISDQLNIVKQKKPELESITSPLPDKEALQNAVYIIESTISELKSQYKIDTPSDISLVSCTTPYNSLINSMLNENRYKSKVYQDLENTYVFNNSNIEFCRTEIERLTISSTSERLNDKHKTSTKPNSSCQCKIKPYKFFMEQEELCLIRSTIFPYSFKSMTLMNCSSTKKLINNNITKNKSEVSSAVLISNNNSSLLNTIPHSNPSDAKTAHSILYYYFNESTNSAEYSDNGSMNDWDLIINKIKQKRSREKFHICDAIFCVSGVNQKSIMDILYNWNNASNANLINDVVDHRWTIIDIVFLGPKMVSGIYIDRLCYFFLIFNADNPRVIVDEKYTNKRKSNTSSSSFSLFGSGNRRRRSNNKKRKN